MCNYYHTSIKEIIQFTAISIFHNHTKTRPFFSSSCTGSLVPHLSSVVKGSPCSCVQQQSQSSARCSPRRCFPWLKQRGFFFFSFKFELTFLNWEILHFYTQNFQLFLKNGKSSNNPLDLLRRVLGCYALQFTRPSPHVRWANAPHWTT